MSASTQARERDCTKGAEKPHLQALSSRNTLLLSLLSCLGRIDVRVYSSPGKSAWFTDKTRGCNLSLCMEVFYMHIILM